MPVKGVTVGSELVNTTDTEAGKGGGEGGVVPAGGGEVRVEDRGTVTRAICAAGDGVVTLAVLLYVCSSAQTAAWAA